MKVPFASVTEWPQKLNRAQADMWEMLATNMGQALSRNNEMMKRYRAI